MICIIQMDKGTPNTNPQPSGWIIAHDISEAEKIAFGCGQQRLSEWLKDHDGSLSPGKYELEPAQDKGQTFVLYS